MLYRLVYYSRRTRALEVSDLRRLLKTAQSNNALKSITGALYYNDVNFIQILEGGRKEVNEIFTKICRDHRHTDVTLTEFSPITKRDFEAWSMLYLGNENSHLRTLLRYSTGQELNLGEMTSPSILALLLDLKQNVTVAQHKI